MKKQIIAKFVKYNTCSQVYVNIILHKIQDFNYTKGNSMLVLKTGRAKGISFHVSFRKKLFDGLTLMVKEDGADNPMFYG